MIPPVPSLFGAEDSWLCAETRRRCWPWIRQIIVQGRRRRRGPFAIFRASSGNNVTHLRRWYWSRLRAWRGELCQDCGGRNQFVYRVPDAVWETATGQVWERHGDTWMTTDGQPESACIALLCPRCLNRRAAERGLRLWWTATAEPIT